MFALRRTCLLTLLLLPVSLLHAQDADVPALNMLPFDEALETAEVTGKKVMVNIFAPWCPYCRKMDQEVFTDSDVRRTLADHFVFARLDGDDKETTYEFKGYTLTGQELAGGLGATGFPTTVFLETNGDYITRLPGVVEASQFMQVLRYIGTEAYEHQTFEEFIANSD